MKRLTLKQEDRIMNQTASKSTSIKTSEPGKLITFGKHKGKTIEQLYFIDYSWLRWAMGKDNMFWIKKYIDGLPSVFPEKVKIKCGHRHHMGCGNRSATMFTVPVDKGDPVVAYAAAYFWCSSCLENSMWIGRNNYVGLSLDFPTHAFINRRMDKRGFSKMLRKAYGIERLSKQAAYDVFWNRK